MYLTSTSQVLEAQIVRKKIKSQNDLHAPNAKLCPIEPIMQSMQLHNYIIL